MTDNILGTFELELLGSTRELKSNFSCVEKLERNVLKKPLMKALNDAIQGEIYFGDVVDTILVGLHANNDTRFSRNQIAEYVHTKGLQNFLEFYIQYLTFSLTGGDVPETEEIDEVSKKK
jgi:hypothetical protein